MLALSHSASSHCHICLSHQKQNSGLSKDVSGVTGGVKIHHGGLVSAQMVKCAPVSRVCGQLCEFILGIL